MAAPRRIGVVGPAGLFRYSSVEISHAPSRCIILGRRMPESVVMAGNVCCTWRMRLNDQVNWREVFGEFIARPSLDDPGNKERHVFLLTLLFTEAGMRALDGQINGRIELPRTGAGWDGEVLHVHGRLRLHRAEVAPSPRSTTTADARGPAPGAQRRAVAGGG